MNKLYSSIIKAGLLAGTLDILAAINSYYLRRGRGPEGVFRYIASGAFGSKAFTGGGEMIVAGIIFHYLIAFGFTILFFAVYPKVKRIAAINIVITGFVYGLIAWLLMNLLVVPLSNTPPVKQDLTQVITGMLFLMVFIGLPVAFIAGKYFKRSNGATQPPIAGE
ncbi:MAG TPA: hypothetical protein VF145_10015 [Chitinophagaceae bacterium]